LQAYPRSVLADEALRRLEELPSLNADDAWKVVQESSETAVLRGFLAALPNSQYAKIVESRLRSSPKTDVPQPTPRPVPAAPGGSTDSPPPGRRVAFWIVIALAALVAASCTIAIIANMSPTNAPNNLSPLTNYSVLGAASVLLLAVWVRIFPRLVGPEGKLASTERFKLQAVGTLIILGWALLTEIFAELNHRRISVPGASPDPYNVLVPQSIAYIAATILVVIIAIVSIRSDSRRLRRVFSGLVLAIGLVAVLVGTLNASGGRATNYWVSMELNLYGGLALILFTAVGWFVKRNDPQSRVGHATPDNATPSNAKQ
jgi:hypothetical protein